MSPKLPPKSLSVTTRRAIVAPRPPSGESPSFGLLLTAPGLGLW